MSTDSGHRWGGHSVIIWKGRIPLFWQNTLYLLATKRLWERWWNPLWLYSMVRPHKINSSKPRVTHRTLVKLSRTENKTKQKQWNVKDDTMCNHVDWLLYLSTYGKNFR